MDRKEISRITLNWELVPQLWIHRNFQRAWSPFLKTECDWNLGQPSVQGQIQTPMSQLLDSRPGKVLDVTSFNNCWTNYLLLLNLPPLYEQVCLYICVCMYKQYLHTYLYVCMYYSVVSWKLSIAVTLPWNREREVRFAGCWLLLCNHSLTGYCAVSRLAWGAAPSYLEEGGIQLLKTRWAPYSWTWQHLLSI